MSPSPSKQAGKLLGSLDVLIARTIQSPGVDEVHDLRVAIRRFTRVLAVLKPCFPRRESKEMRRSLKKAMLHAGEVRDRDIALRLLEKLALPKSARLSRLIRTEREEAALTLIATLRHWVRRKLPAKCRDVEATADEILPEMAKELFTLGKAAAREKASVEEIHEFRIAAKNFRYTLDFFAPVYGASHQRLLKQLKSVQALLGDINDCASVRRLLSGQHGARPVLAALKKRQRKKIAEFRHLWDTEWNEIRLTRKPPARAGSGHARLSSAALG